MSCNPIAVAPIVDVNHVRQLVVSSEHAGWSGMSARFFRGTNTQCVKVLAPPAIEDIITIQTAGSTELTTNVTRHHTTYHAVTGDITLIPRSEPTEWEWTSPCEVFCLYPDPTLVSSVVAETIDRDPARIELVGKVNIRDALVYHIGLALLGELRSGGLLGNLYVETLSQTLVVHLLRHHAVFTQEPTACTKGLAAPTLRRVLNYVNENLAQDLKLADMAALAHLSPYYFARLFRQSVGQSLHQYVIERRIEKAKELLLAGKHSVTAVAMQVGFDDHSHLHRHFKRRYGITPQSLIRQRKNVHEDRTNIHDSDEQIT